MNNVLLSATALADAIANLFRGMGDVMRGWMLAIPMSVAKGVFIAYFLLLIYWIIKLPESEGIPIVGRVAAGSPILAEEHIEDYCELPASFFNPNADYLLQVRGDSMIECGIMDGDLLAVHRTRNVNNGDIVVARIEDEVTVKRFKRSRSKHQVTLLPENKDYSPIEVDLHHQEFEIEGLGVGVIRH